MVQNIGKIATGAGAALVILSVVSIPRIAVSAEYARRIAIAPFANLTGQEEIKPVVSVLPRLLSTRLMALAGAEVVLLPPGEKSAEEGARDARAVFLLHGTVSKLGKGYSIDTTVTDLSSGKSAGAFFAAAASEDDIIPQLGVMSGEIVDKVFGVRPPAPVAAAAPAPAAQAATASRPSPVLGPAPPAPAGSPGRPRPLDRELRGRPSAPRPDSPTGGSPRR